MQTEKAKMPVAPRVSCTMVLAESNSSVRLIDAMASGAPCEMIRRQVVVRLSMEKSSDRRETLAVSFDNGFHQ